MYIAWEEAYIPALKERYDKGVENGVDGIEMLDGEQAMAIEPELRKLDNPPIAAVWLPSLAHVEPYDVTVALAENAAHNGVKFWFNTPVCDVLRHDGRVEGVVTPKGIIKAGCVINCAGVYADDLSEMAGDRSFTIHPRKGTIAILDKAKQYPYRPQMGFVGNALENRMKNIKNVESKGGGCCKTPEGNYLLGPSAKEVLNKEDTATDPDAVSYTHLAGFRFFALYTDTDRNPGRLSCLFYPGHVCLPVLFSHQYIKASPVCVFAAQRDFYRPFHWH